MRRKSAINREKRLNQIARARRLSPEERVEAAASLSQAVKEIEVAGKLHREGARRKKRS